MKANRQFFLLLLALLVVNGFVLFGFYSMDDRIHFALQFRNIHPGMSESQVESLLGHAGGIGGGGKDAAWFAAEYRFGLVLFVNHVVSKTQLHFWHDSWGNPTGPYATWLFLLAFGSLLMIVIYLKNNWLKLRDINMNAFHLRLFLPMVAILMLTACSRLTEENLQKVHNGMTPAEVKAILGEPTSTASSSALGIITGTTFTYHSGSSDVKITFLNDKVIATEGDFK